MKAARWRRGGRNSFPPRRVVFNDSRCIKGHPENNPSVLPDTYATPNLGIVLLQALS